jgi:hypothetical protein
LRGADQAGIFPHSFEVDHYSRLVKGEKPPTAAAHRPPLGCRDAGCAAVFGLAASLPVVTSR